MPSDATTLWSHHRLQVASCPRRFHALYEEGMTEPTSPEAARGSLVHEAAEAYVRHLISHKREQDRRFAADLAIACDDSTAAEIIHRIPDVVEVDPALVFADGEGIEREFDLPLPNGDRIRGRFDRLDYDRDNSCAIVTDYKTFPCWKQPDRVPTQLMVYACAAKHLLPAVESVTVRRTHFENGFSFEWELDAADLSWDWLVEWVSRVKRNLAEAEKRGKYPACPGSWCQWCGLAETCWEDLGEDTAREAGEKLVVLEAARERLRKRLQAYTKESGALLVGDLQWGYFPPQYAEKGEFKYTVKPGQEQAASDALRSMGEDPAKYLRLQWWQDGARFGKLVRKGLGQMSDAFAAVLATEGEIEGGGELVKLLEREEPGLSFGARKLVDEGEEA